MLSLQPFHPQKTQHGEPGLGAGLTFIDRWGGGVVRPAGGCVH